MKGDTFFFKFIYFWERARAGEGQKERETQNLKLAPGSELSAQSLTRGLNSQTVRSWPEPKSDAQPTEPPKCPFTERIGKPAGPIQAHIHVWQLTGPVGLRALVLLHVASSAASSAFLTWWPPKGKRTKSSKAPWSLGSEVLDRHFRCILLSKAHHVASSESGRVETDSISRWQMHQSHIAKSHAYQDGRNCGCLCKHTTRSDRMGGTG